MIPQIYFLFNLQAVCSLLPYTGLDSNVRVGKHYFGYTGV